jgi:transcription elongation factor/antiterminator RfaH
MPSSLITTTVTGEQTGSGGVQSKPAGRTLNRGSCVRREEAKGQSSLVGQASGGEPLREDTNGDRWYVVHTQPHAELRVVANLLRQEFRPFCPLLAKTVRHARKVTQTQAPLFPNYLFVSLDVSRDRWRSVNGTFGVVRLLTYGDVPIPVPKGIVESIEARLSAEGVNDWSSSFACGQVVRICDGPFADLVGRIEHLDGARRVRILLDLMGRAVTVITRTDMLAPSD